MSERPEQPVGHLHLGVVVRVVDADRRSLGDELVGEALARLDGRLGVGVDAVHRVRDLNAVEVHRGRLGQAVLQHDPHLVAVVDVDLRCRHDAVVRPGVDAACRARPPTSTILASRSNSLVPSARTFGGQQVAAVTCGLGRELAGDIGHHRVHLLPAHGGRRGICGTVGAAEPAVESPIISDACHAVGGVAGDLAQRVVHAGCDGSDLQLGGGAGVDVARPSDRAPARRSCAPWNRCS